MPSPEPVIFTTAFEGVRKAFGHRFTPELVAEMKAVGVDFEALQAGYPFDTWFAMSRVVVKALMDPDLPVGEQYRRWGRDFMPGYVQTTVGFATLTMARLLGVRRTLHRMGRNFKTSGNYTETTVTDVEPGRVHLHTWVLPEYLPRIPKDSPPLVFDYRHGVLEGTLDLLNAPNPDITIIERDEVQFSVKYDIRWGERASSS